jgi:hypothetical protein
MTKPLGLVEDQHRRRAGEARGPAYRAVTLGTQRADWAVVNVHGDIVYRGDAKTAAMIANRLSLPAG